MYVAGELFFGLDNTSRFEKLLGKMAKKQCTINFVSVGGGSPADLASVAPRMQ